MKLPDTPLVSVKWLNNNLAEPNLIIIDASIYADRSEKFIEYQESVPGTLFFDLRKDFVNIESKFPNTVPQVEQFEKNSQKLGIKNDSVIVVYDNRGIYTSPRVWWLYKLMGHQSVFILNGGLPAWKKEGFTLSFLKTKNAYEGDFKASPKLEKIALYETIIDTFENNHYCIIDARSKGRFNGTEPEPRSEIKSGHIEHSYNLPYTSVLKNGFFKSDEELKALFSQFDFKDKDLIFTCGSGITACIIMFAAELILSNKKAVYDGSWTEWAFKQELFTA